MTTFNSKLRLQLLANKKLQRRSGKGFTLIELMVTVATLGTLAAVAFPAFSGAQQRAAAGATIGSMQGFAKECATNVITDNTTAISGAATAGITMSTTDCGGATSNITLKNDTDFNGGSIAGLKCGDTDVQDATTEVVCTLTVNATTGVISGAWGATGS